MYTINVSVTAISWTEIIHVIAYSIKRLFWLFFSVVVGTYIAILIANWGGKMDAVRSSQCREEAMAACRVQDAYNRRTLEEKTICETTMAGQCVRRYDLDKPFLQRSVRYLVNSITLDLGRAQKISSDSGSKEVWNILRERLPATIILFGTANLLLFFTAISAALYLSRHYGSLLDRTIVALAPTSIAPGWLYGIFFLLVFAGRLAILPWGGMVDIPPPSTWSAYGMSLALHMLLPVLSIISASLFFSIYSWRTFFLIYSSEDYVEMAKAKGLPANLIQQRYILRPALPPILTSFAFMLISMWEGSILTETIFNWPGIGRLLSQAIGDMDIPVIIGEVVIYGYLLAFTTFILDIVYAIVDPRVRVRNTGDMV